VVESEDIKRLRENTDAVIDRLNALEPKEGQLDGRVGQLEGRVGKLEPCAKHKVPIEDKFKYISAKGDAFGGVDIKGVVKIYKDGDWTPLPLINGVVIGSLGVSPDGWHQATGDNGGNYRYNPEKRTWDWLGTLSCTQVSAMSKDLMFTRCWDSGGTLFKNGHDAAISTPKEGADGVPGQINWVSVGSDGEIWIIARDGKVYRQNAAAKTWDPLPIRNAANLDVENANRAIVTTKFCWVYIWDGKNFNRWDTPDCVVQATINKNKAYYIDELDNLYTSSD